MTQPSAELSDIELAASVASQAGALLMELRESFGPVAPDDLVRRKQLKDEADRESHLFISKVLHAARPGDAVLSEEGVDATERDSAQRVWIVDPLDGTSEYGQGRTDCAVHVALWDRAATTPEKLVAGVVDMAAEGYALTTADTELPNIAVPADRPIRIVVSRSRPPEMTAERLDHISAALSDAGVTTQGVEVYNVGSVGAKVAEVLARRADAYVHDTGFYEWDVAAPLAVAQHYGLAADHIDGQPVTFNHRPTWVTDLRVCLPELVPFLR